MTTDDLNHAILSAYNRATREQRDMLLHKFPNILRKDKISEDTYRLCADISKAKDELEIALNDSVDITDVRNRMLSQPKMVDLGLDNIKGIEVWK